MSVSTCCKGRVDPSDAEKWMTSLTVEHAIGSANPENPASVVSAIRFLLQMSIDLQQHGNHFESINCAESALLLRHANNDIVQPLLEPLVEEGLIERGKSTVEEMESLILRCNSHAVRAFNEMQFDAAEYFLGKAIFLTDKHGSQEMNFFHEAEARRLRLRAATLNNLGCMEKRRKRLDESITYLRQAVELEVSLDSTSRGSPSTYLNLCTVLNEMWRHHEAVNAAECAIAALEEQLPRQTKEQLPSCVMMLVVGLYNLGVSLERRASPGDEVRARASYQRALETSRRYLVDPSCPTLEAAMAEIRRMHAAPAFREDKPDEVVVRKKRMHKRGESLADPQQQQQQTLEPLQEEQLEKQTSSFAAGLPGSNLGTSFLYGAHSTMRFAIQVPQQKEEEPKEKIHKEEEKKEPQEQQLRSMHSEGAGGISRGDGQRTRTTRLTPLIAIERSSVEGPLQHSSSSRRSSDKPFISSTSLGSCVQQRALGANQPLSRKGSLTPIHLHATTRTEKPLEIVSRTSFMTFGTAASRTSFQSIGSPAVITGDKSYPAARLPSLMSIKKSPSSVAGQPWRQGGSFLQAPEARRTSFALSVSSNPFGRRVFNSSNIQSRPLTDLCQSRRRLSQQELASFEKHLRRSSLRLTKIKELKKKADGVLAKKESETAISKAKERELKRQARAEAIHDAEVAEELYGKFVAGMRADRLARCNKAATLIQRNWRGCLARTLLCRMINAARKIQQVFRSYLVKLLAARKAEEERLARLRAEQEKRELEAALVLQKRARQFLRRLEIWRAYLARRMQRYYATRRIQRAFRAFLKWREEHIAALIEAQRVEDERQRQIEMNAARCIQWARRRYMKRKEEKAALEREKQRERAAAKIQALLRGVLARAWFGYYKSYKREQELKSAANQKRIVTIQSCARVLLAARLRREKEIHLTMRLGELQLQRSVVKVQCQWRSRIARIKYERLRAVREMVHRCVARIQRWYKRCVMRQRFFAICETNRRMRMAKKIQFWFRECKQRIKEREMARYYAKMAYKRRLALVQSQAIVLIQAWWRSVISRLIVRSMRDSFLRLMLYAEELQRLGRGYAGRRAVFRVKCRIIKEARMRVEHDIKTAAACVIQRAWRCAMAKDIVEQMRRQVAASVCISKNYRSYLCRKELFRLREAKRLEKETCTALVIQRAVRQFLKRLELVRLDKYYREKQRKKLIFLRREEAATSMQAAWRGRATRMALEREREALAALSEKAIKIQRMWRAFKFRINLNHIVTRRSTLRTCRNKAALTLQCFWRRMRAAEEVACLRELVRIRRDKAIVIQCWWRRMLAMWELEYIRSQREDKMLLQLHYMCEWEAKVTLVNTFLRVRSAQHLLLVCKRRQLLFSLNDRERERFLNRYTAATKIQAVYRGHYQRVYARSVQRQKEEEERQRRERDVLEKRAALIIQCAYRSWRAIREAKTLRAAKRAKALEEQLEQCATADSHDVVRQLFWIYEFSTKRDLVKERLQSMNKRVKAASVIQCVVRRWFARRRLEELRRDALYTRAARIIQSHWKKYCTCKMQKELNKKRRATIVIQACFRGNSVRREWKKWREQLAYKKQNQALEENIYDSAATLLQSCWRRNTAKRLADRVREQRQREKEWRLLNEAASTIQRAYRRYRMYSVI